MAEPKAKRLRAELRAVSAVLTYDEAAALLSVSRSTVRRLCDEGKLDRVHVTPNTVRVTRASCDRFIRERTRWG
jgi:excisionase family DNA binding protein